MSKKVSNEGVQMDTIEHHHEHHVNTCEVLQIRNGVQGVQRMWVDTIISQAAALGSGYEIR